MKITSEKIIMLEMPEHDAWMLKNILVEFKKGRSGSASESDSFDKFAENTAQLIGRELPD